MGNQLCVIAKKTKRKATTTKPTTTPPPPPLSTLNLETNLQNYTPPNNTNYNSTPSYTCEFCCEPRPIYDSFSPEGCCHFYCTKCTLRYIVSKLQNNALNLTCPESACGGKLTPHSCKQILPNYVLVWWERALCESVIPEKDKFYCPFNDCSALLLLCSTHSENSSKLPPPPTRRRRRLRRKKNGGVVNSIRAANCPHCKRNVCVQCRAPWHSEISCKKFQRLKNRNDDLMLDLAKRKKWRRCPNCKHYVEKKQGCDDMTCRCFHRFCYNCGASIYNHVGHDCFELDD